MHEVRYFTDRYITFREMTEPEFFKIKSSLEYIRFYRQFEELFELVRYNVSEFWMYLVTISEYHRLNRVIEYDDFADPTLICNQRLANILTSFRTYLDHIAHKLSNRFGNQSHQYDIFKRKHPFSLKIISLIVSFINLEII